MSEKAKLSHVTLATVGGGMLERMFQRELEEVAAVFGQPGRYKTPGDTVKCVVTLQVELRASTDSEDTAIASRVSAKTKRPDSKASKGYVQYRDGSFKLTNPGAQVEAADGGETTEGRRYDG